MAEARPYSKDAQLARGERRYRRKVASPKQWQAIIAAKQGPCRVCETLGGESTFPQEIEYHHIVARVHGGHDTADNIAPLCSLHHGDITRRSMLTGKVFLASLSDAEYAYMVTAGGEDYPTRAYGVSYER